MSMRPLHHWLRAESESRLTHFAANEAELPPAPAPEAQPKQAPAANEQVAPNAEATVRVQKVQPTLPTLHKYIAIGLYGLDADYQKAAGISEHEFFKLYKSAIQGDRQAQFRLGALYQQASQNGFSLPNWRSAVRITGAAAKTAKFRSTDDGLPAMPQSVPLVPQEERLPLPKVPNPENTPIEVTEGQYDLRGAQDRTSLLEHKIRRFRASGESIVDRKRLAENGIDLDRYLHLVKLSKSGDALAKTEIDQMLEAANKRGLYLPRPGTLRQSYSRELGGMYWEAGRGTANGPNEWFPLEYGALQTEMQQRRVEAMAAQAVAEVKMAEESDRGYGTLDIPYAEGSIIISVSPGLADTSSALQNVPGTQGAKRRGLSPSIMLENRRIGLNPFYKDVRHRSTAEQSSVHRDAETQARALEQLGIRLIQTEDGTRFKVLRPMPEGEWITINGHRITGYETQAIARQREWEAKVQRIFQRKEDQEKRMRGIVIRMDLVSTMTKKIAEDGTEPEKAQIDVIKKQYNQDGKEFVRRWREFRWPMTGDFAEMENALAVRERILSDGSASAASLELHLQPYLQRKAGEEAVAKEKLRQEQEAAAQRAREAQEVRANVAPLFAPISKRVQKADGFKEEPVVEVLEDRTATMTLTGPAGRSVRIVAEPQTPEDQPADVRPFKTDPESKAEQVAFRKEFPMPNGDIVAVESEEVETVDATGVRLKLQVGAKKEEILLLSRKISDTAFAVDIFENGARRTLRIEGDELVVRSLFEQINLRLATERRNAAKPKPAAPAIPEEPASPSDAVPKRETGKPSPEVQRQIDLKKRFEAVIADPALAGKAEFIDQGDANWSGRTVDKYLVRISGKDVAHVYIGGKEGSTIYVVDPLGPIVLPVLNPSGNVEIKDEDDAKKPDGTLKDVLSQVIDAVNGGGAPEYWGDLPLKRSPQTKEERTELNIALNDMKHAEFLRVYAALRPIALTNPSPHLALSTATEKHNNALPAVRAAVQKLREGTDEDSRKTLAKAAMETVQNIPSFIQVSLLEGVVTAEHPEHDALWKMNVNSMLINRLRAIEKDGNLDTK